MSTLIPPRTLDAVKHFGADPDGNEAASSKLNAMLAQGGHVRIPAGTYLLNAQLVIGADTWLEMSPDTILLRDWAGTIGNRHGNATLRNTNAPTSANLVVDPGPWVPSTVDENIRITGGRIRPTGDTKIGGGLYLAGVADVEVGGTVIERTYQDWAFTWGGDRIKGRDLSVLDNQLIYEDGCHVLYGTDIDLEFDRIVSGDDSIAIGAHYNLPVDGVTVHAKFAESRRGFAVKIMQLREGLTAAFDPPDQAIQNVNIRIDHAKSGTYRNGLMWAFAAATGVLRDIDVTVPSITSGDETHDGVNAYGCRFEDVERLTLHTLGVQKTRAQGVHLIDCPDARLISPRFVEGSGTNPAVDAEGTSTVTIVAPQFGDVDRPVEASGGATITIFGDTSVRTRTVASGAVAQFGAATLSLLAEGGVSDTLATITFGRVGQQVRVKSGEASPGTAVITLTAGTGSNALNIGTNYALNSADRWIDLEYDGYHWREIRRSTL